MMPENEIELEDAELGVSEVVISEEELDDVSGASLPIPRLLNT
ncbi:hypothetical protein [Streptomyces palmae]|nr:hypothetical protein [Streptomyces palmae]